jgi:hypothetical protein
MTDLSSKTAICLSGQIRTGILCAPGILEFIGAQLNICDFFIHTWDVDGYSPFDPSKLVPENEQQKELIRNAFVPLDQQVIDSIKNIYKPVSMKVDNYSEYSSSKITENKIPQWWSIWESNQLKIKYEEQMNSKYKNVVRMRFDVTYGPTTLMQELFYMANRSDYFYVSDPHNKCPDAIEDICWIAPSNIMDTACNFALERSKVTIGEWQSHMADYLQRNNIKYKQFKNNWITHVRSETFSHTL